MIEPLDYLSMMGLVQKSFFIITDSGGLQKEAYFAGKRAIVVMPDTGWRELADAGWNILSRPDKIKDKMNYIINNEIDSKVENIYGDGNAGEKIAELIKNKWVFINAIIWLKISFFTDTIYEYYFWNK